jgi:hypothetical protein
MLRRLLRNWGRPPARDGERRLTFGERLLETTRQRAASRIEGSDDPNAVVSTLARAMLEVDLPAATLIPNRANNDELDAFARANMQLILDNDRLPPSLQLAEGDLERPRALLGAFFFEHGDVQQQAHNVLRFIERRFSEGRFAQAGLLLQLFDTDEGTRRNNERNLFFEEMAARFLAPRARTGTMARAEELAALLAQAPGAVDEGTADVSAWLDENVGVRLHLLSRNAGEIDAWQTTLASVSPESREAVEPLLPPWRWRALHDGGAEAIVPRLIDHLAQRTLRDYVLHLTRCAYFAVLTTGRNGLEPLIFTYLRWISGNFDCFATRILPTIHRETTVDERSLSDTLDDVYDNFLGGSRFGTGTFSEEAVREAATRVYERMRLLPLTTVPEGEYDFGGLVMDELFGIAWDSPTLALRVHRIL